MLYVILAEQGIQVVVVYVGCRHKILLGLVLCEQRVKILYVSVAEEYLSLAVLYILLDI